MRINNKLKFGIIMTVVVTLSGYGAAAFSEEKAEGIKLKNCTIDSRCIVDQVDGDYLTIHTDMSERVTEGAAGQCIVCEDSSGTDVVIKPIPVWR